MKTAAIKKAGRQYRVVRWFLLPEAELAAAGDKVKYKPAETEVIAT